MSTNTSNCRTASTTRHPRGSAGPVLGDQRPGPAGGGGPHSPPSLREESSQKHISKPKDLPQRVHCPDQTAPDETGEGTAPREALLVTGEEGAIPALGALPPDPACPPSPSLQGADRPTLGTSVTGPQGVAGGSFRHRARSVGDGWGGAGEGQRLRAGPGRKGARGADRAAAAAGLKTGVTGQRGDPAPAASPEGGAARGTAELASLLVLTLGACC